MSKYIKLEDAENAVAEILAEKDNWWYGGEKQYLGDAELKLSDLPTIDIVRCKECDYWTYDYLYDEYICCNSEWTGVGVKADDFCSYGERIDKLAKVTEGKE